MKKVRSKLSYANVISTLALFLILAGGTAFAAAKLAKNSVGTNQIKNGAVTGSKVKPGSLTKADFGKSQLQTGSVGPAGPTGATGAAGPPGAPGTGRNGKSVEMAVFRDGPSAPNAIQQFAPSGVSVEGQPIFMVAPVAMEITDLRVLTPQQGIGQAVQIRIEESAVLGEATTPLTSCTVGAGTGTCTSAQTAAIPAGELLSVRSTNGPGGASGGFISVSYTLKPN